MISENKKKLLDIFAQGRKKYKLSDFKGACKLFAEALKIDSEDGPSQVYYARCKHYVDNPPAEDWDGVFVMTSK
ncbi:MAG: hypothetical protein KAQ93_05815 [Spirochaetales bacterium]|nr:hypothetical protein [Spirochaetales bacterium]